jgi:serine/threonine protein kinase
MELNVKLLDNLGEMFSSADINSKYHIDRKIGQGAFGEVYVGRCKNTGTKVCALLRILK